MQGKINEPKIIIAKRQPKNVLRSVSLNINRDHTLQKHDSTSKTFIKCTDPRCEFCKIVISDNSYITKNKQKIDRNFTMTCKTMDLLYILICAHCKAEYVGETGVPINERTNLHRNQIIHEKYRNLKVSKHIFSCRDGNFQIFPFYKCFKQCHIYREEKELEFRKIIEPELH